MIMSRKTSFLCIYALGIVVGTVAGIRQGYAKTISELNGNARGMDFVSASGAMQEAKIKGAATRTQAEWDAYIAEGNRNQKEHEETCEKLRTKLASLTRHEKWLYEYETDPLGYKAKCERSW
jgi:hypothetical protein